MDIPRIQVKEEQFSPIVVFCSHFTSGLNMAKGIKIGERRVYDYEIEYIVDSRNGHMMIGDKIIEVNKGEIVFRHPGQKTEGIMPYASYFICFDILGKLERDIIKYELTAQKSFQPIYKNAVIEKIPQRYMPINSNYYYTLFDEIFENFVEKEIGTQLLIKSNMLKILYSLYKELSEPVFKNSPYCKVIKDMIKFIKRNSDKKLNLELFAKHSGLSPSYFHKIFTDTIGLTPNEFYMREKMKKAKELLVNTQNSIEEIAYQCGFSTSVYFCTAFKRKEKITPTEFRKRYTQIQ